MTENVQEVEDVPKHSWKEKFAEVTRGESKQALLHLVSIIIYIAVEFVGPNGRSRPHYVRPYS